ncbi:MULTISPECIES: alpha-amylase family glycosyl hydrolase [unclassified Imperialibacter]|uniref:alpha-amylase family glycosyl hydrolase n=1 Tax=unclassified Imperialibacter TaxID=2629706 RepID=UPI0012569E20|nr:MULTISPECIES: alpha-amylase family glycosyl hydrolase [unclassified Imperialibacter]CAD5265273.1 Alpha-amylase [Imperialibacter sp. 89]CAD5270154.1 Alpha-amylase [Imperialibacter sp. 75]VVT09765.1 Alpha-amylase [Imperialibacter sp. EC-SDR9]
MMLRSIQDIDLSPKPNKTYWANCDREWREEFIYFLLIDRFHDDHARTPSPHAKKRSGFGNADQLQTFCGGTIRGITKHLDYIHDLGCTALWLSPLFENNEAAYHGYAIQNYLEVDKRFGTKEDLAELVDKAHAMNMRVFLDIVLHHSGDNWFYKDDMEPGYYNGNVYPFGGWRFEDRPLPVELRDTEVYWKKGRIRNFDTYPETREGDFFGLKSFKNDESPEAKYVQDILTKIHCYWIRETDIDGFRLDAVKHMGEKNIGQFCSLLREYAYRLGKKNFFLFGELVGSEELYNKYIGPKTSIEVEDKAIYYGLNSVLDFPLYYVLANVIKGHATPEKLIERYESLRRNAMARGEFGEFLVTFLDNHDQVGQGIKRRFGKDATDGQIIAGVGFLLCALGTPCIYYGTEQGFDGAGEGDWNIREAMFDLSDNTTNALNKENGIYQEIAKIAAIRKKSSVLKFGRMYIRKLSRDGKDFHLPVYADSLIAFSRMLYDEECVVAYNHSLEHEVEQYVTVDKYFNREGCSFHYLYGGKGEVHMLKSEDNDRNFIKVKLQPSQFVILTNR